MSLVIDNLKKLKKHSANGSVPPGMINLAPKKRSNRPSIGLLALLVISIIGAGVVFYIGSGSTSYKVAPPVRVADKPSMKKPAAEAPKPTPEADIQARIDAAVSKALEDSDKEIEAKVKSTRAANIQRMTAVDALPKPADTKPKQTETLPMPRQSPNTGVMEQVTNIQALQRIANNPESVDTPSAKSEPVAQKPAKPILTDSQRKEFKQKVQYNTLVTMADRALKNGEYERAIENYSKALSSKPSPANLVNMLKAMIRKGDMNSVEAELLKFSKIADERVISVTAMEMAQVGQKERGLDLLRNYLGKFDNDGRLYYSAGQIHENAKDYMRAETAYGKAVELLSVEPYYIYSYARMLDINNKYDNAIAQYTKIESLQADENLKKNASARAAVLSDYLQKLKTKDRDEKTLSSSAKAPE